MNGASSEFLSQGIELISYWTYNQFYFWVPMDQIKNAPFSFIDLDGIWLGAHYPSKIYNFLTCTILSAYQLQTNDPEVFS